VSEKRILAWHFVSAYRKYRDGNTVVPGYIYSVDGPLLMCQWGLHASKRPLDALRYAPGPVVCRVEQWGDVQHDTDKFVSRHREVLWVADASIELRRFACWCARQVWPLLTDERSRHAVEVAEAYCDGKATKKVLTAANTAAWAASDAAWSESAASATALAASAAANAAARAANAAAWTASDAEWSVWAAAKAASAATRAVAWTGSDAQNTELEQRLLLLEDAS
jgi:hypothetical protein